MAQRELKRYEFRLVDRDSRKVASVWMNCADDAEAAAVAVKETVKYRVAGTVGYELRLGRKLVEFVSW